TDVDNWPTEDQDEWVSLTNHLQWCYDALVQRYVAAGQGANLVHKPTFRRPLHDYYMFRQNINGIATHYVNVTNYQNGSFNDYFARPKITSNSTGYVSTTYPSQFKNYNSASTLRRVSGFTDWVEDPIVFSWLSHTNKKEMIEQVEECIKNLIWTAPGLNTWSGKYYCAGGLVWWPEPTEWREAVDRADDDWNDGLWPNDHIPKTKKVRVGKGSLIAIDWDTFHTSHPHQAGKFLSFGSNTLRGISSSFAHSAEFYFGRVRGVSATCSPPNIPDHDVFKGNEESDWTSFGDNVNFTLIRTESHPPSMSKSHVSRTYGDTSITSPSWPTPPVWDWEDDGTIDGYYPCSAKGYQADGAWLLRWNVPGGFKMNPPTIDFADFEDAVKDTDRDDIIDFGIPSRPFLTDFGTMTWLADVDQPFVFIPTKLPPTWFNAPSMNAYYT
ncbi:MAG: hypothetical protein AAF492_08790, partial [Verrucomicrobiota bacterium]